VYELLWEYFGLFGNNILQVFKMCCGFTFFNSSKYNLLRMIIANRDLKRSAKHLVINFYLALLTKIVELNSSRQLIFIFRMRLQRR